MASCSFLKSPPTPPMFYADTGCWYRWTCPDWNVVHKKHPGDNGNQATLLKESVYNLSASCLPLSVACWKRDPGDNSSILNFMCVTTCLHVLQCFLFGVWKGCGIGRCVWHFWPLQKTDVVHAHSERIYLCQHWVICITLIHHREEESLIIQ